MAESWIINEDATVVEHQVEKKRQTEQGYFGIFRDMALNNIMDISEFSGDRSGYSEILDNNRDISEYSGIALDNNMDISEYSGIVLESLG